MTSRAAPAADAPVEGEIKEARRWRARPGIARALRVVIAVGPILISVGFTLSAGLLLPPERLGIGRWTWVAGIFVLGGIVMWAVERAFNRLLPLVALMKLTLVFPDQAPSRIKSTWRASSSRKALQELAAESTQAQERGDVDSDAALGEYLVSLLNAVSEHDRPTRGHSERVRVYAEMLGEQIGLPSDEIDKLRWSALLHDVGKLSVDPAILNKPGRPSDEEWEAIAHHPVAARDLVAPLEPWLGDWVRSVDQHHCRWDGSGYPDSTAGTDITLAGRLVAIADSYDVMTSTRSYKTAMSHQDARAELTRCAGTQFDPALVRAFLGISLGELRTLGGPTGWIANLAAAAESSGQLVGSVGTAAGAVAAATVIAAPPPTSHVSIAEFEEVASAAANEAGETSLKVRLSSSGEPPVVAVSAGSGTARLDGEPELVGDDGEWVVTVVHTAGDGVYADDDVELTACVDEVCETTSTRVAGIVNEAPSAVDDAAKTAFETDVLIDVLANDHDPDDPLQIVDTTSAANGIVEVTDSGISYTPDPGSFGSDSFTYTLRDSAGNETTATVTVEVEPMPVRPPRAVDDDGPDFRGLGDAPFKIGDVTANDTLGTDQDPLIEVVDEPLFGRVEHNGDGTFTYTPSQPSGGRDSFSYSLTDRDGNESIAHVVIVIDAPKQAPIAVDDAGPGFSGDQGEPLHTASVLTNDSDPDHDSEDADPSNLIDFEVGVVEGPAHGEVSYNGDGTFTYRAFDPDFHGSDRFTYRITDRDGLESNHAVVTVQIAARPEPPKVPPVSADDAYLTRQGTPIALDQILANDLDADGSTDDRPDKALVTISIVAGQRHGTLQGQPNGLFNYVPDDDFYGTDRLVYRITDRDGLESGLATVVLRVDPADPEDPMPDDDIVASKFGSPIVLKGILDNDLMYDEAERRDSTIEIVHRPVFGTVEPSPDGFPRYVPPNGFVGRDTLTYRLVDKHGIRSAPALVTIEVG